MCIRDRHIMGVAGRQQTEERLLLVSGISIGQNHRVFLRHRPLYMVRLSVVYPNKRLLDGNGPLQHGLHRYVIGPAEETADIDHMVAVGNQGIYAYSVVPDHAPPRRSDPAAEAAHTVRDFQLAQVHIVPVLPDRQSGCCLLYTSPWVLEEPADEAADDRDDEVKTLDRRTEP